MIIYIHGFKSAGGGAKADCLKALFPDENVLSPTLPDSPAAAIDLLNSIIEPGTTVVGTSLGGFYAAYLHATNPDLCQALIINPVVDPLIKMACHLGEQVNFKTKEPFTWTTEHLAELQELSEAMIQAERSWDDATFVVGTQDPLTDPGHVRSWYGCDATQLYNDDHRFGACFSQSVLDHLFTPITGAIVSPS
jgi:predicted esterase YcpF (UPF0227 family)